MTDSNEPLAPQLYPTAPKDRLLAAVRGRRIDQINAPAPILDVGLIQQHCDRMLDATKRLGWAFRAHVKSHKTTEVTAIQVGAEGPVNLIVSTISEAEHLVPFVANCRARSRPVSLVYGYPAPPSSFERLAKLSHHLGEGVLTLLVDDLSACTNLEKWASSFAGPVPVLIKVDSAYGRAGLTPESQGFRNLVQALHRLESQGKNVLLKGLYSHGGHSYGVNHDAVRDILFDEIEGLVNASYVTKEAYGNPPERRFLVTLGATPTALAAGNQSFSDKAQAMVKSAESLDWELHAGVYPLLDIQQVTTESLDGSMSEVPGFPRSPYEIALRVLVEVVSVYEERDKPQALVTVGTLALGREPCKHYPGWAIMTPWEDSSHGSNASEAQQIYDPVNQTGWMLGKISQEHGILTWEGPRNQLRELIPGEKLLLWPNHACVAGAAYDWYYVVDSRSGEKDVIQDVYVRWRGW